MVSFSSKGEFVKVAELKSGEFVEKFSGSKRALSSKFNSSSCCIILQLSSLKPQRSFLFALFFVRKASSSLKSTNLQPSCMISSTTAYSHIPDILVHLLTHQTYIKPPSKHKISSSPVSSTATQSKTIPLTKPEND
jgi:hypothetical protein